MVRDVRYITLNCCYRDLQSVLMVGHLKTLALVESAGELGNRPHSLRSPVTCASARSNVSWCFPEVWKL